MIRTDSPLPDKLESKDAKRSSHDASTTFLDIILRRVPSASKVFPFIRDQECKTLAAQFPYLNVDLFGVPEGKLPFQGKTPYRHSRSNLAQQLLGSRHGDVGHQGERTPNASHQGEKTPSDTYRQQIVTSQSTPDFSDNPSVSPPTSPIECRLLEFAMGNYNTSSFKYHRASPTSPKWKYNSDSFNFERSNSVPRMSPGYNDRSWVGCTLKRELKRQRSLPNKHSAIYVPALVSMNYFGLKFFMSCSGEI